MKEADFYSAEEAAKALGIPVRQVFGMLCGGELEGHQDEWARWRVPASAVQRALQAPGPSYDPGGSPKDGADFRAAKGETPVGDAAATAVLGDGKPLWKPPGRVDLRTSCEETTQEAGEAPLSASPQVCIDPESSETETTEMLPRGDHLETTGSDADFREVIRELTERLSAADAKNRELQACLELAAATEASLRESLEHERQRADRENARAEGESPATGRPGEEPTARWGEGLWRRLFR